jgi:predicted ATPase
MIRSISLENFKSWKQSGALRFAPITGLFGTNGSGKSSILQWLLLQKQTVESSDRKQVLDLGDEHSLVDLGSFRDVVYGHNEGGTVSWTVLWSVSGTSLDGPPFPPDSISDKDILFSCSVIANGVPVLTRSSYLSSWGQVECRRNPDLTYEVEVSVPFELPSGLSPKGQSESPLDFKFYGFPSRFKPGFYDWRRLSELMFQFEELFRRVHYLGPLREHPRRYYQSGRGRPSNVGPRGEKVFDALLASRSDADTRAHDGRVKSLEEITAYWLRELGLIDRFSMSPVDERGRLFQVLVQKTASSTPVAFTDVGFGVSQILPVIVLCYYVPEGSIVLLEHPEIHLHPSAQAGLADLFVEVIRSRKIQVVLESHSEHLIRRLQRRIAEEVISKDDVAFYFCQYQDDQSLATPLEVDPFGNIVNWPKDFFGDELGEMAAMTSAAMERLSRGEGN